MVKNCLFDISRKKKKSSAKTINCAKKRTKRHSQDRPCNETSGFLSYSVSYSLVFTVSPAATALEVSKPTALSINGSTTKFTAAKIKPDIAHDTREIIIKINDFINK